MAKISQEFIPIELEVIHSKDATIVMGQVFVDNQHYGIAGTAKRDPQDAYNEEIGVKLAVGRALSNLGAKLQRQASGLVKCAEDNAIASARAKEINAKRQLMPATSKTQGSNSPKVVSSST